jgi:hypothetical protein
LSLRLPPVLVLFWVLPDGDIVDLNLEVLKNEIVQYLESSEFAVFRSHPGGLEGLPVIAWDTERCPDYRAFLDVARKTGEKLVLFAARELAEDELDEALEELAETELARDERRELETRLATAQRHIGSICSVELAFGHNSHLYLYEARPDWYEDFLEACEEISSAIPYEDDGQRSGNDGLGGFYSNN